MIEIEHDTGRFIALLVGGRLLFRYVYVSEVPQTEAPRPYFHPLKSLAGDTLTNFRPNDHPWHHALSLTLNTVSGVNFWGGPTFVRDQGYQSLANHGAQFHVDWEQIETRETDATLIHTLEWRHGQEVLFREWRSLEIAVDAGSKTWSMHWQSRLTNVSGRVLTLENPHTNGATGSHYNGLQFRGARELLDDHLDPTIRVVAEGGRETVDAIHGSGARWMEWHGQMDTTLRRVVIRFANNTGPVHWFVRRAAPLAAIPVHFDQGLAIEAGAELNIDHTLTFITE